MNLIENKNRLGGIALGIILTIAPWIPGCSDDENSDEGAMKSAVADGKAAASDGEEADKESTDKESTDKEGADKKTADKSDDGAAGQTANDEAADSEGNGSAGQTADNDDAPSDGDRTWFVVSTQIYGDTTTSYIPVVSSLDMAEISLDDAKELDGRGTIAQVGEWLFVATSTEPVVTRYTIADDGSLTEDGRLNFSNHGVPEPFAVNAWGAVFVDEEKAYIFNGNDGSHVIWNPTTMKITGEIAGPAIVQEGYDMESVAVVRGDRMYRVFTFLNYTTWEFLEQPQYLAVYDVETDELIELKEEARCVQLYALPSIDDNGDIYFSGHVWTPGLTLAGDYKKSCALRVKAGEDDFDPTWQLNFADEVTEGREAATLRIVGEGKALLDVFHDERVEISENSDPQELVSTSDWRLWLIDLEEKAGAPIEGIGYKGAGLTDIQIGDRTFLMLPNADWSETTAWELLDGEATESFKIQGNSYQALQLR